MAFTTDTTVSRVAALAATRARVSILITANGDTVAEAMTSDTPLLISQELAKQASDALGELPHQAAEERPPYQTAVILTGPWDADVSFLLRMVGDRSAYFRTTRQDTAGFGPTDATVEDISLWISDQTTHFDQDGK